MGGAPRDAQHIAAEMVSVLSQDFIRPGLAAVALTTDTSILTAIANDFGYGAVFERQIDALGRRGDVVVGITTSGNSESVVRALRAARDKGMRTIALTGRRPGNSTGRCRYRDSRSERFRAAHSGIACRDRPHSVRDRRTKPWRRELITSIRDISTKHRSGSCGYSPFTALHKVYLSRNE